MELCKAKFDFIGLNYYRRQLCAAIPLGSGDAATGVRNFDAFAGPITDFAWEVWPDSFYELVMRITREYNKPLIEITENGCSYLDCPDVHGRVPDERRIDFTRGYLSALGRAMKDGANVRGYHHWSLIDNFEWAEGFAQRFGLVWVDFRDEQRIIKDSGYWYGKLAASGSLT
jgi:beta-glucosidase